MKKTEQSPLNDGDISINDIRKFRAAFKKDYGISLNDDEAKESFKNLVDFFSLLWQFDQEQKQKEKQMEIK